MTGSVATIEIDAPPGVLGVPTPPAQWSPPSIDAGLHRVQVAVRSIRPKSWLGELLHAQVADGRNDDLDGSASMTVTVPADDPSFIALLTDDHRSWGGVDTGRISVLDRELYTVEDGKVTGCYLPRGRVTRNGPMVTIECTGSVIDDRTLGRGRSNDLLFGAGLFPGLESESDLDALGWERLGGIDVTVQPALRRLGENAIAIRGNPLDAFGTFRGARLRKIITLEVTDETTYQNLVRATAFLKVPSSVEDGWKLMEVLVYRLSPGGGWGTLTTYPPSAQENTEAAYWTDGDTVGEWDRDPYTAVGRLPLGPYLVQVHILIYPQSETEWMGVDEVRLVQRDNLSTGEPRDLVVQQEILLEDAQNEAKGKTTWNKPVVRGELCGIVELGVWWREDDQPLRDALLAISGRAGGPDFPWVDAQGRFRVGFRRGTVRDDLTLGPAQIHRVTDWVVDEGARVSQVRSQTDYGDSYYRISSIATDTSQTSGHLIERITRAPNDMSLFALDQLTQAQLDERAQAQETCVLWVDLSFGWTIEVGDTFRVAWWDGPGSRLDRVMRVTNRAFHDRARLVALTMGTDDLGLGRPAKFVDLGRQLGRDRHAIGDGLAPTLGRNQRERRRVPARYRPPAQITYSGSRTSATIFDPIPTTGIVTIQVPIEGGPWLVSARQDLYSDTPHAGGGAVIIQVDDPSTSATDSWPTPPAAGSYEHYGSARPGLVVNGPGTVEIRFFFNSISGTITGRDVAWSLTRLTPASRSSL